MFDSRSQHLRCLNPMKKSRWVNPVLHLRSEKSHPPPRMSKDVQGCPVVSRFFVNPPWQDACSSESPAYTSTGWGQWWWQHRWWNLAGNTSLQGAGSGPTIKPKRLPTNVWGCRKCLWSMKFLNQLKTKGAQHWQRLISTAMLVDQRVYNICKHLCQYIRIYTVYIICMYWGRLQH